MSPKNKEELEAICTQVRRDILRMVHAVNSGHPGGSLGCTDYIASLYFNFLNCSTDFKMDGIGEDLFFLSNGHISPVWYSVLARRGFFPVEELATFRKLNSRLQGHPATEEDLPGIRIASGSLGQGLSVACGAAMAKKLNGDDKLVYILTGDGELQEGQNWEALMFAAHHKVDNLIAAVDWNNRQIDGDVSDVMDLGDLEAKFRSFGWKVMHLNGNDLDDIDGKVKAAKSATGQGQPIVLLMKTEMGQGVNFMMGTHAWHGKAPNDELLQKALEQLPETLGDY